MVKRLSAEKSTDFNDAYRKYAHFKEYWDKFSAEHSEPTWYEDCNRDLKDLDPLNIVYPVGDPIFIHVYKLPGEHQIYHVIEPVMSEEMEPIYNKVQDLMIEHAHKREVPEHIEDAGDIIIDILNDVVSITNRPAGLGRLMSSKIPLTQAQYNVIKYFVYRNRVGYSKLEPLFYDPWLEDIHCTGVGAIKTIHKVFEMVHTSIVFADDVELDKYCLDASERVERPVSDARPVVDAVMPDGSRVNYIYGREVSQEGSSFTIRKFFDKPVSITSIVNWGTMSAEEAAYIWLCFENGMNMFVCGETASGKTTSLNAAVVFIKPDDKVFTVESVPEVKMPHDTWQHLVTRESGKDTDITIFTLLIAALRSRPNYIIVGEIRGAEGNVAFQAMQTGHPVLATFHAGTPIAAIQRLTGDPINVPIASIDNLHIIYIQMAVTRQGRSLRRCLGITEIVQYYAPEDKVIMRTVFTWDAVTDKHRFRGLYNSYILEKKVAAMAGYKDTRDIYKEMFKRTKIIEKMIENEIFDYYDVWDLLVHFYEDGDDALPFAI